MNEMVTNYRGESNLDIVIEASHGKNREKCVKSKGWECKSSKAKQLDTLKEQKD